MILATEWRIDLKDCITIKLESRDFQILTWKSANELEEHADLAKKAKHASCKQRLS